MRLSKKTSTFCDVFKSIILMENIDYIHFWMALSFIWTQKLPYPYIGQNSKMHVMYVFRQNNCFARIRKCPGLFSNSQKCEWGNFCVQIKDQDVRVMCVKTIILMENIHYIHFWIAISFIWTQKLPHSHFWHLFKRPAR